MARSCMLAHPLGGWIRGLGKGVFGMWAFKAHHGLSKPIMGFCFQKNGPHIFGRTELVGTLPQAFFFLQKNGPQISGSPALVGTLPQAPFFPKKIKKMTPKMPPGISGSP